MAEDRFRSRLDALIDLRYPWQCWALGSIGHSWNSGWDRCLHTRIAPMYSEKRPTCLVPTTAIVGGGVSPAGRPRLPFRLMASLLHLKHAYGQSDESVCDRWAENVVWQFFSGMTFYEPRPPCDATQIGRFRKILGEAGMEELLRATLATAHRMQAVTPADLERVVVDTTSALPQRAVSRPGWRGQLATHHYEAEIGQMRPLRMWCSQVRVSKRLPAPRIMRTRHQHGRW